jgi:hypothetical protein
MGVLHLDRLLPAGTTLAMPTQAEKVPCLVLPQPGSLWRALSYYTFLFRCSSFSTPTWRLGYSASSQCIRMMMNGSLCAHLATKITAKYIANSNRLFVNYGYESL